MIKNHWMGARLLVFLYLLFVVSGCLVVDNSFNNDKARFSEQSDEASSELSQVRAIYVQYGCTTSSCHGSSYPENLLNYSNADYLEQDLVVPGNADQSWLWKKLQKEDCAGDDPCDMPKNNTVKVSTEDLATIRTWIEGLDD